MSLQPPFALFVLSKDLDVDVRIIRRVSSYVFYEAHMFFFCGGKKKHHFILDSSFRRNVISISFRTLCHDIQWQ